MNLLPLRLFIGSLLLLSLSSCLVLWLMLKDTSHDKKKDKLIYPMLFLCMLNLLFFLASICFFFHTKNPFHKLCHLLLADCAYWEIGRLSLSTLTTAFFAFFMSYFYRLIKKKKVRKLILLPGKRALSQLCILFSLLSLVSILANSFSYDAKKHLQITGFCRKTDNLSDLVDLSVYPYDTAGFVDIKNTGILNMELRYLYLSDDEDYLSNVKIPGIYIPAGKSIRIPLSEAEEGFDLSKDQSGLVILSDGDSILDQVELPALAANEYYKKEDEHGESWQLVSLQTLVKDLPSPVFSADSGFYEEAFDLTITADADHEIYYTLDGSIPTKDSMRYDGPIHVYNRSNEPDQYRTIRNVRRDYLEYDWKDGPPTDKLFLVRAIAMDKEGNQSPVTTASYLLGLEKYKNKLVISLASDPDGLFGDENGICVVGSAYDTWYKDYLMRQAEAKEKNLPEDEYPTTDDRPAENYIKKGKKF